MSLHAATVLAAELPNQWLLARASGLLAWLLLTSAVVFGLTLRTRLLGRLVPPAYVTAVHQSFSLVGLVAVAIHGVLIALDTKVDVPMIALVVPGTAGYRPLATSLGVVAAELWLLVHVSFRLRRRIGMQRWRALHMATFPTWALAAAHGVAAGTDSATGWTQQLYAWPIGLVAFLLVIRTGSRLPTRGTSARTPTTPPRSEGAPS